MTDEASRERETVRKFTRNESASVDLAIRGLAEATQDDHELLERGMAIFDGLYTVLKRKT